MFTQAKNRYRCNHYMQEAKKPNEPSRFRFLSNLVLIYNLFCSKLPRDLLENEKSTPRKAGFNQHIPTRQE